MNLRAPANWNIGLWPVRLADISSAASDSSADCNSAGRTDRRSMFRVSAVRLLWFRADSVRDRVRFALGRLHRRNGTVAKRIDPPCGYIATLQSWHPLQEIFRPRRSTSLFGVLSKMGRRNPAHPKSGRLVFLKHWQRAVEPDAAA